MGTLYVCIDGEGILFSYNGENPNRRRINNNNNNICILYIIYIYNNNAYVRNDRE